VPGAGADLYSERPCSPGNRPADPTVTVAPPGALDPGWAQAVAGVLDDPSRHRLAFQPVADLQRGTVAGYEALSRFAGPPDAGPDVWFEAAGRLGLGAELDARVLERVVGLRPELPPNCFLTVNLDPNHLVTGPVQWALAAAPTWSSWTGRCSPAATATRPRRP
jgi:hypothetical protein